MSDTTPRPDETPATFAVRVRVPNRQVSALYASTPQANAPNSGSQFLFIRRRRLPMPIPTAEPYPV